MAAHSRLGLSRQMVGRRGTRRTGLDIFRLAEFRGGTLFVHAPYASLDLLVQALTITVNGKLYGLEAWLKMGRTHAWLQTTFNRDKGQGNFITDLLICLVQILEEGFEIFNPTDSLEQPEKPVDDSEFPKIKDACQVVLKIEYKVKCGYADKCKFFVCGPAFCHSL
jgi:hypothetical protein